MPNDRNLQVSRSCRGRKRRWGSKPGVGDSSLKRHFGQKDALRSGCEKSQSETLASCSTDNTEGSRTRRGQNRKRSRWRKDCQNEHVRDNSKSRVSGPSMLGFTRPKSRQGNKSEQHETSCPGSNNSQCDIPGFYYDAEKKRYFKILPGHNNVNVVTRESVARKTAEEKRITDLTSQESAKSSVTLSREIKGHRSERQKSCSFIHAWQRLQQGDVTTTDIESFSLKSQVVKLKPSRSVKIFPNPFGNYEKLEHMLMMEASSDFRDILALWSIKDALVHRIQLLHVDVKRGDNSTVRTQPPGLDVEISTCGNIVLQSLNKITHMCWAPSLENPNRKYILYTTMCYTGYSPSLALFRSLEPGGNSDFRSTDFCLGKKATWTCAWNPQWHRFSVGTEKSGLLLDVETRRLWELFSNNSDVLAQAFTRNSGQSLLSGTRKGEILTHDLRSRSTHPVSSLHQQAPISSLRFLQDDVYLLASDITGRINLWDLRMKKTVLQFKGHSNMYSKLPIYVDQSERILYSVGEDCYTRFWDLKTGELLKSIPPPCPASRDTIPRVLYSQQWAGCWGQTGMLMGLKDKLHLYGSQELAC